MKNYYNMTSDEALQAVQSSLNGLTTAEAEARLARDGKNQLAEGKKRSLILRFFDQLKDVMIIVLLVAALVSAIITIVFHPDDLTELIDSGIILLIVIVNAVIGLTQEAKAESALEALKNMNKPIAKVIRDGVMVKIDASDIVIGDIVVLEAGDSVPADLRLLSSASLKIEEAALTGESVPSEKDVEVIDKEDAPLGDRKNMAYSGGAVAYGRGQGVVVGIGMGTEVGKIATMLQEDNKEDTPLQVQLAKTAKVLSVLVLAIAVIIFVASLIKALVAGHDVVDTIIDCFMEAVAIAVAAIPEGLPAVVTIVLAIGVQRMSERKAIVKNLPSVETLGCCQIICSDKTGTLTLNQMTVKELYALKAGAFAAGEQPTDAAVADLLNGMILCNDTIIGDDKLAGDPTETALVAYAQSIGMDVVAINQGNARINEIPFDSGRKLMTTVNRNGDKDTAYIKGAPDILVSKCSYINDGGKVRKITAKDIDAIKEANHNMAMKALRVLAVATKVDGIDDLQSIENEMCFVGLVGMIDPPRPEVKGAVQVCKRAGMRAIMITGDHADTARAIATEIGILDSEDQWVITGPDLDKLSEEEFLSGLDNYRVFARVSPENKVRIVKAFKSKGYIVAMTGDGVNDAPSIKAADIGIGMGITGTDVSKGAADMVLSDDNFATIINAVEEGRKVYANIKKAIQFLLSANIAEVLCLFAITMILDANDPVTFLSPVMILWVNLVTDSLPALALGMEKAESDVMDYPPRKQGMSLFAGKTGIDIIIQGIMQTALVLSSFAIGYNVFVGNPTLVTADTDPNLIPGTMAFLTLCMIQLFHSFNLRSQDESLFRGNPLSNKYLNLAFLVGLALISFVIFVPFMHTAFDTVMLGGAELGVALGCAVMIIPLVELQKLIEKIIKKARAKKQNKLAA